MDKIITTYRINEDGRRYHDEDDVAYILPIDDDETGRIDGQHRLLKSILGRTYKAPVAKLLEEGIKVLDSGCGPASWIFDLAEVYPKSKFYGVDITDVIPKNKPTNFVEFAIGNVSKNIPFPDNTFDYIHHRLLFTGFTSDNWDTTLKEYYRVLKPGGFIEVEEASFFDATNLGPLMGKLLGTTMDFFQSLGVPPKVCSELENRLINAGFEKQVLEIKSMAINHGGKLGDMLWEDMRHAKTNARPGLAKACKEWEDIEFFKKFLETCGAEAKQNKTNVNWYDVYAQKPL